MSLDEEVNNLTEQVKQLEGRVMETYENKMETIELLMGVREYIMKYFKLDRPVLNRKSNLYALEEYNDYLKVTV